MAGVKVEQNAASCDNGNPMRPSFWHAWLLSLLLTGCRMGIQLSLVASASQKPSNVAALVSVTKKGAPVRELDVTAFRVYEDNQPLDRDSSGARLLDPALVIAFQTVVVVDLNQGTTEEGRRQLSRAAAAFVRKVRQRQPVTVYAYDGSARSRLVGDFTVEPSGSGPEQLENIMAMVPTDPSRNLRGAVLDGLEELDARLNKTGRPVQIGTLVVFSRGPDIAGRVSQEDYDERVLSTNHQLVYVDVAGDASDASTERLSGHHHVKAQSADSVPIAFEEAAGLTSHLTENYYLISYCSPARAGSRRLRIEVTVAGIDNEDETDSFETSFDASGFYPGCNANSPPKFVRALPLAPTSGKASTTTNNKNASNDGAKTTEAEASDDETEVPPPNKPGYAP